MNLRELEIKQSMLLAELATETNCKFSNAKRSVVSEHSKSCPECKRMKEIGDEYQEIRQKIKEKLGRTNAVPGWDGKRDPERAKWRKVAEANGISKWTFDKRVGDIGMSYEDAATKPLRTKSEAGKMAAKKRRSMK